MCEPATIIAGITAVVSAAGAIQSGNAQKKMAEYNAQVAEAQGKYNAERQQDRARRLLAQGRVNIAKSGIQVSGSPLDVLTDNAMNAELDRLAILRSADSKAAMSRMEGSAAQQAGYFGAATSLLSGAGRAYGLYAKSLDAKPPVLGIGAGGPNGYGFSNRLGDYDNS